jgi:hypothetical protein
MAGTARQRRAFLTGAFGPVAAGALVYWSWIVAIDAGFAVFSSARMFFGMLTMALIAPLSITIPLGITLGLISAILVLRSTSGPE